MKLLSGQQKLSEDKSVQVAQGSGERHPAVSILMPVYNALPYLKQACESMLHQSFSDFELIALDDASVDGSPEYLESLQDSRIRVIRLPKAGLAVNLNIGLSMCRAPLVARMDADDVSELDRLEKQVAFMNANPDYAAVGCQGVFINGNDEVTGQLVYDTDDLYIRYQLSFVSPLPHPGVVFRLKDVLAVGGYIPSMVPAEDYDLWCRLSVKGKLINLPDQLLRYRRHSTNITTLRQAEVSERTRDVSVLYLLGNKYLDSEVHARSFIQALTRPASEIDEDGENACIIAMQRLINRASEDGYSSSRITELRKRLRWFANRRAAEVTPWSSTFFRWLRIAQNVDPQGMRIDKLIGRAIRSLLRPTWNNVHLKCRQ